MTVLEQERGAVLLRRDGEVGARAEDPELRGLQLDASASRGARVRAHRAHHLDRRFLRQLAARLPPRVGDVLLRYHRLHVARAVAQHHEGDLAARAGGGHPGAKGDGGAGEPRQVLDAVQAVAVRHRRGMLVAALWAVNATACVTYVPSSKLGPARQDAGWVAYLGNSRHDACAAESLAPDPRPLWRADVGRAVRGGPGLGERVGAVGVAERVVTLLDRATGQALWRTRLRGTIHAGPLLEEERLYVATEAPEGRVYALRLHDGRTLWSTKTESVVAPLALEGDTIYAATERGTVLRLGAERGAVAWRRHLPGAVRAAPVATPLGLAVATAADTLYLLDKTSGEVRARLATPGTVLAAPALAESRLYFGTTGGHVLAVELPGSPWPGIIPRATACSARSPWPATRCTLWRGTARCGSSRRRTQPAHAPSLCASWPPLDRRRSPPACSSPV